MRISDWSSDVCSSDLMDGLELLRRLREKSQLPVIFLTSKDDEIDEALGLAIGADDYIAKPFSQRLVIARIRALPSRVELNKSAPSDESVPSTTTITPGHRPRQPATPTHENRPRRKSGE